MIKFFRSLPLHFRSAFRSIRRRFGSAVSSIFAVSVTLILMMLFIIIASNFSTFSKSVENNVKIFVTIDSITEKDKYNEIEQQIKNLNGVQKVTYSSKEEQLDMMIESPQGGEEYSSFKEDNPLLDAYYVEVKDGKQIDKISKQIKQIDGIMDAGYGGDSAMGMINAFNAIRNAGAIFVAALCALAIFLISNTIRTNIHARREEIGIMRNVGANNWFIKTPFLIEGVILGALGAVVPIILACVGYNFMFTYMKGAFFTPMFPMLKPVPFIIYVSLILLAVGMVVGFIGSLLSVNKYLKWKR